MLERLFLGSSLIRNEIYKIAIFWVQLTPNYSIIIFSYFLPLCLISLLIKFKISDKYFLFLQVLDRLLLYLRVVHSVDYYNSSEYPSEDEMPNRCGIMHARGSPPSSKVTQQEINDYISHFELKSQPFLQSPQKLDEEECIKLGKKDPDVEVEKFIQANTQELAKDKWLCPLSGKKFKGPEFVRKHIFNKHGEKIEEVKKEVK